MGKKERLRNLRRNNGQFPWEMAAVGGNTRRKKRSVSKKKKWKANSKRAKAYVEYAQRATDRNKGLIEAGETFAAHKQQTIHARHNDGGIKQ